MREAIATVMLTVGLATLGTVALSGATLDPDTPSLSITAVVFSSIIATGIGIALVVQIGLSSRRAKERIAKLVEFQEGGTRLARQARATTQAGQAALETAVNAWADEVNIWLKENLPAFVQVFLSTKTGSMHIPGIPPRASEFAIWTENAVDRLGRIILAIARNE